MHCREIYCLLHVVVQGPGSFPDPVDFSVRRTVAELRGVELAQFPILAFVEGTCAPPTALLVATVYQHKNKANYLLTYSVIKPQPNTNF